MFPDVLLILSLITYILTSAIYFPWVIGIQGLFLLMVLLSQYPQRPCYQFQIAQAIPVNVLNFSNLRLAKPHKFSRLLFVTILPVSSTFVPLHCSTASPSFALTSGSILLLN